MPPPPSLSLPACSLLLAAVLAVPTGPGTSGPGSSGPTGSGAGATPQLPPSPSLPPPPPCSPPESPPPPQPPGLCLDTCNREVQTQISPGTGPANGRRLAQGSGNAGVCEDGILGGSCTPGTDCSDCGHRAICFSCPADCAAQISDAIYCLEAMWLNDKTCYDACNTRECEHRGCSVSQAASACIALQDASLSELQKVPALFDTETLTTTASASSADTTPVAMQVSFGSFELTNGEGTLASRILASVSFEVSFMWRDSRVAVSPCGFILPSMLSITKTSTAASKTLVESSYSTLVWLPSLSIASSQSLELSTLSLASADAMNWTIASPDNSTTCEKCLKYTASYDATVLLDRKAWTWGAFPFDDHVMSIVLQVPGADLYTCSQAIVQVLEGNQQSLLPGTNEWVFDSDHAEPVVSLHPADGSGGVDVTQCEVRMHLTRSYFVFLIKTIVVSILVVYSGLAGVILDGRDHTGDRTAIILVAALIVTTSFQTDLGLGTLHYLIWWDYFNVMQMTVLLTALVIVLWEHRLIVSDREQLAVHINMVTRVALLVGLYPLCLVAFFIYGFGYTKTMLFLLLLGLPLLAATSFVAIRRRLSRDASRRTHAIAMLHKHPPSHPAFKDTLRAAYAVFDKDASNQVDMEEIRELMCYIFRDMTPEENLNMFSMIRTFADGDGQGSISFNALYDGVQYLATELAESPQLLRGESACVRSCTKAQERNQRLASTVRKYRCAVAPI